jgi:hypothetical protein
MRNLGLRATPGDEVQIGSKTQGVESESESEMSELMRMAETRPSRASPAYADRSVRATPIDTSQPTHASREDTALSTKTRKRKKQQAQSARRQRQRADQIWSQSRAGSHAGRGFHYQDAVAVELALEYLEKGTLRRIVPEGLEDISLDVGDRWVHVEVKSRREKRGPFKSSDLSGVWRRLAERLVADPTSRGVLVLERPLDGAERAIGSDRLEPVNGSLRRAITRELDGLPIGLDDFVSRVRVEVRGGDARPALDLLRRRLDLPLASCHAHYSILRSKLASKADANGEARYSGVAGLDRHDLEQMFETVSMAIDPSVLDEAVRTGRCQVVDFADTLEDGRFYEGVDVLPGHVSAGLALERPDLTQPLVDALERGDAAIVTGPSGAGKSALLWLTAWETRHHVTWHRVRTLRHEDIAALAQFAQGCEPTASAPIGFVVDDVGTPGREGWDELASELRHVPHTKLLGACREEDLLLLATASQAVQVRPELDEELAARLYEELRGQDRTSWQDWREPYAQAAGMLLEYGHLLTAGERLEVTVGAQVRRRVRERRDLELEVLRLVATAHAYGAEIEADALAAHLEATAAEMQAASARLIDEHMIREGDQGQLAGMHELRSRAISAEVHRLPPARLEATAAHLCAILSPRPLQRFLTRLLGEAPSTLDAVAAAVAERANANPSAPLLSAALHALRLAGFGATAARWAEIVREADAVVGDVVTMGNYAIDAGAEPDIFSEPFQRTVERMRAEPVDDFRTALLDPLAPDTLNRAVREADERSVTELLSALGGTAPTALAAPALADRARELEIDDLRDLLAAARDVSPSVAADVVSDLGGEAVLMRRLERELPWVRNARVGRSEGGRFVAADVAQVAERAQPDPHGAVVDLCRYLLAFVPTADVACSRALDARGEVAGMGVPVAEKEIPRGNLPTAASVAWNRARIRALIAAVSASTYTERLVAEREIVNRAADLVPRAAETYLTGIGLDDIVKRLVGLATAAKTIVPTPAKVETAGPLDHGEFPTVDAAGYVGAMIANNLVPRLFAEGATTAPVIPGIVEQIEQLEGPAHWSLLADAPLTQLTVLKRTLWDLHAVLSDARGRGATAEHALRKTTARRGSRQLPRLAAAARQRAAASLRRAQQGLRAELARLGYESTTVTRAGQADTPYWPRDEILVLVEVPSLTAWMRDLEQIMSCAERHLADRPPFLIAPVRGGRVVVAFALQVVGGKPFPATDGLGQWPDLPHPPLEEFALRLYRDNFTALVEISGILGSLRANRAGDGVEAHSEELETLRASEAAATESSAAYRGLVDANPADEVLAEVGDLLAAFADAVEAESDVRAAGGPPWRGVAAEMVASARGARADWWVTHIGALIMLAEWDVHPCDVLERLHA